MDDLYFIGMEEMGSCEAYKVRREASVLKKHVTNAHVIR
jgi:hypothetical protein